MSASRLLHSVAVAAAAHDDAAARVAERRAERDEAIRAAAAGGVRAAVIARSAGVTRMQVGRILAHTPAGEG